MSVVTGAKADSLPESGSRQLKRSILERIGAGDQAAVEECLAQYGGLVWSLATRMSHSSTDAEDACQEIFVEIWQKAERFDPVVASEATFITVIARRRLIDRHRRMNSQPETVSMNAEALETTGISEPSRPDLVDEAAKAARCLDKLSHEQQKILKLSIHHGVSHGGISKKLSIPLGTVKSFARRGLIQLRDCMKRNSAQQAAGSAT